MSNVSRSGLQRGFVATVAALLVLAACTLAVPALRHRVAALIPHARLVELDGLRFGYRVERDVRIAMPDGIHLAASLYLPRHPTDKLATILVRVPYNRLEYGEGLNAAENFARRGYAVLVEDLRGTSDSEGELMPYRGAIADGSATLDWIVAQPWSNGRVGSFGCSALGETQYVLARARHPALRAMIPLGAGGAVGSAAGRYSYFGLFEGGVFELASGFGWFEEHGARDPRTPAARPFDIAAALRELPVADLVERHRPGPNGYADFLSMPLTDPKWHDLGYLDDDDVPAVPTLEVSTWGDQTVGDTLAVDESLRRKAAAASPASAPERHLLIGPGTHCHAEETGESERFGELSVKNAAQPYAEMYERWFDFWLRDRGDGLAKMPAIRYYLIGEARWLDASRWPPAESSPRRWYLDGAGHANSADGDGALVRSPPARLAADDYVDDPMHPVPSHGGPVCCTGQPDERPGPANQKEVESRADVLVYTSSVLDAPQRIAGPLHAVLTVSSSAPDTDFVARLVDVFPDGRAISIQEGALRARYRAGIARPSLLVPGERITLTVDMRSIAYSIAAGHRLRLDVASSSFPRLERNLHTGGDNSHDTHWTTARNRVFHGADALSYVELPLLPVAPATP